MKRVTAIVSLAAVLFCAAFAFGQAGTGHAASGTQQGQGGPETFSANRLETWSRGLKLTEDQKTKVKLLLDDEARQLRSIDEDRLLPRGCKTEKNHRIQNNTFAQVRPLLSTDQQTNLDALEKSFNESSQGASGYPCDQKQDAAQNGTHQDPDWKRGYLAGETAALHGGTSTPSMPRDRNDQLDRFGGRRPPSNEHTSEWNAPLAQQSDVTSPEYLEGYAAGYRAASERANHPSKGKEDTQSNERYRYSEQAYRAGHTDGEKDGRQDRKANKPYDSTASENYRKATNGYKNKYGDEDQYQEGYRHGYKMGYRYGYRSS